MERWGVLVKKLREAMGLTSAELAEKSGINSNTLRSWESKRKKSPDLEVVIKLAKGFGISKSLFENYLTTGNVESVIKKEILSDLPEKDRTPGPEIHYIYKDFSFHAGSPVRPVDHFYFDRPGKAPKNIEGYIVRGTCLTPKIEEGDVIIVDRDGSIDNGDYVACLIGEDLHVGRLRKVADELYLENNNGRYKFSECLVAAPIIEVNKRLKGMK